MSDTATVETPEAQPAPACESPPPAAIPARQEPDPRQRLAAMARELTRARNQRLMYEYLRLRRSLL